MASNEHAYLSEGNLHNPKGLSTASNSTVCSKDGNGALQWVAKQQLKTSIHTFAAFTLDLQLNYHYPESIRYGQSPYELDKDYGSTTISSSTTKNQKEFFRIANHVMPYNASASSVFGCTIQATNNSVNPFTVALVKYSPSVTESTAFPVVMVEQSITGSNDNLVYSSTIGAGSFSNNTVLKGDHLFLMAKTNGAGGVGDAPYIAVTLELQCTDWSVG
jgi:hypothetical protein